MALPRQRARAARWLLYFVAAYVALSGLRQAQGRLYHAWWERADSGWFQAHNDLCNFVMSTSREILDLSSVFLGVGTLIALGITLARVLRRRPKTNELASRWSVLGLSRRYPVLVHRVLPGVFGGLWFLALTTDFRLSDALTGEAFHLNLRLIGHLVASALAMLAAAGTARAVVRTLDDAPDAAAATGDSTARPLDDATFTAVAVTPTTRGAVAALALVSIAMTAFVITARSYVQMGPIVIGYVLSALGAATLFRYVSRIVVGIDGMLVTGMGRTRVFGYATFDDVRASGSEILLVRGARVLVRLQLPPDEEPRIAALVEKLRDAMTRAASLRNGGADLMMQMARAADAPSESLGSSSHGGGNYRRPAMAREQLWELIEGPLADATARTVAARALAPQLDDHERARLRVAAENSADPRVRVALLDVARDDDDASDAGNEKRALPPVRVPTTDG